MSRYSVPCVARFKDIVKGLTQQTSRECEELIKARDELNRLREPYQRFCDLSLQIKPKEERIKIGFALALNAAVKDNLNADYYPADQQEGMENAGVALDSNDVELTNFSLWRLIREIVRQTAEIRVFELESHLKSFGVVASRAAIESALATHSKEFKITKRGREKFVSLKGV
jgi:hypothetical protein